MIKATQVLRETYGYKSFHPMQEEVISHILRGKDALVLMPTGGGKSLCFQIPALCLDGLTLVISPLLALQRDQVEALRANGVVAGFLNSSQEAHEAEALLTEIENGRLKLLYISPEKLFSASVVRRLPTWNIALIAIDEAHCISFWGHDFRPEYAQLGLLRKYLPKVPLVALTATADPAIRQDILNQLEISEDSVFLSSFDRPNIHLSLRPGQKRFEQLYNFLKARPETSGIVYCLSRLASEQVATKLKKKGYRAAAYHAGLSAEERESRQDAFLCDKLDIITATVAFGMGIDKSNIRWVVHWNLPKNLESFYQEIGRAGRDGLEAESLLFYSYADIVAQRRFLEDALPERRELLEAKLEHMKLYAETRKCRRRLLLSYLGEYMAEDCGNCDRCENPPETFDASIVAQKFLSAIYRTRGKATLRQTILLLRGTHAEEIRRAGWHELKTFGVGRDIDYTEWMDYGFQLISMGYAYVAYNRSLALELSPRARTVLRGEEQVELVRFVPYEKEVEEPARKTRLLSKYIESEHADLFDYLRAYRKKLADEHSIPAYIIFSDKSLKDMAVKSPKNARAFRTVHGVGEVKAKTYGPLFLRAIAQWKEENQ